MSATVRTVVVGAGGIPADEALSALREDGVVVLRGAFPEETVDEVVRRAGKWLEKPAIAGAPGYSKIDHPKKLLDPCLIGGPVYDLIVREDLLDLAEAFLGGECVLAECNLKHDAPVPYDYFPHHTDFFVGWQKKQGATPVLAAEDLERPIGLGGAIYLHDTDSGAFCYCVSSHRRISTKSQANINDVPEPERSAILSRRVRVDGRKGDLVLFDDRGYHGPDLPMSKPRTVILVDYYSVPVFGRRIVTPYAIWSTDLGRLSRRQQAALGAGAEPWGDAWTTLLGKYRRSALYPLAVRLVESSYLLRHLKASVRTWLRR